MRDVSLRQIRAFLAVASAQSFSKATVRLHVSTSALSVTIRELESRLGLRLFERTTRAVSLTPAGVEFLPIAERLINSFDGEIDGLIAAQTRKGGRVLVGAAASVISVVLGPAIADLHEQNPSIHVGLIEDVTQTMVGRVLRYELDFGVTTLWAKADSLVAVPFLDDRLGILAVHGHPLGREESEVTWRALQGHSHIALMAGAGIRASMELDAGVGDLLKRPTHEVSSISALSTLVRTGLGVAIIPALTASSLDPCEFVFRPLLKPIKWRNLYFVLARGRGLTPSAYSLLACMARRLEALRESRHIRTNRTFTSDVDVITG